MGYTLNVGVKVRGDRVNFQVTPLLALGEIVSIALLVYMVLIVILEYKEERKHTILYGSLTSLDFSGLILSMPDLLLLGEGLRPLGLISFLVLFLGG